MNEEEKKVVEKIKTLIQYLNVWKENFTVVPDDVKYLLTILNLIDKLNKVIDEMAEELNKLKEKLDIKAEGEEDCFIPREYLDIDECVKQKSCKNCIKQYFIRKVEEDDKN